MKWNRREREVGAGAETGTGGAAEVAETGAETETGRGGGSGAETGEEDIEQLSLPALIFSPCLLCPPLVLHQTSHNNTVMIWCEA